MSIFKLPLTYELLKDSNIRTIYKTLLIFPDIDMRYSYSKPKIDYNISYELLCNIGDKITICDYSYIVVDKNYDLSYGLLTVILDYDVKKIEPELEKI